MPACPSSTASAQRSSRPSTRSRSKGDGWTCTETWLSIYGGTTGTGKEGRSLGTKDHYFYITIFSERNFRCTLQEEKTIRGKEEDANDRMKTGDEA